MHNNVNINYFDDSFVTKTEINDLIRASLTPEVFVEWNSRMLASFNVNVLFNSNAKYYVSAGTYHAGLVDVFSPDIFYTENSASGIFLKDWVNRLVINDKRYPLINLMCSGTCGAPF
ncbi:MAG: hypothetical protein IPJ05_04050 [Nitrosomonas sp.]|nr:hypothetical protein [Nitrosomonas sp.]